MMYCIIKIVGDIVIKDVEYKILQNLVETQDFITIKEISKNANISERTVRYALDNIDYVLKKWYANYRKKIWFRVKGIPNKKAN